MSAKRPDSACDERAPMGRVRSEIVGMGFRPCGVRQEACLVADEQSSAFFWRECRLPAYSASLIPRPPPPTWRRASSRSSLRGRCLTTAPLTRPSRRRAASGLIPRSATSRDGCSRARSRRRAASKSRQFTPFAKGFFIFSPSRPMCRPDQGDRRYRARRIARARAGDRAASGDTSGWRIV